MEYSRREQARIEKLQAEVERLKADYELLSDDYKQLMLDNERLTAVAQARGDELRAAGADVIAELRQTVNDQAAVIKRLTARPDESPSGELAGRTDSLPRASGALGLLPELAVIRAVMFGKEKP